MSLLPHPKFLFSSKLSCLKTSWLLTLTQTRRKKAMVTKSSMLIKTATKLKQLTMDMWGQGSIPEMELRVSRTRSMQEGERGTRALPHLPLVQWGYGYPIGAVKVWHQHLQNVLNLQEAKEKGKEKRLREGQRENVNPRQPRNQPRAAGEDHTPQPSSSGHTQGTIGQTLVAAAPSRTGSCQLLQQTSFKQHLHHSALTPALRVLVRLSRKPKKREVADDLRERMRHSHSLEAAGRRWWESQVCCLL